VTAARIGLAKLYGPRGVIGHLWAAWLRPPFKRPADLAGAVGLEGDAESEARATLGDLGPGAVRNDALAQAILRGLHRAGRMPAPGHPVEPVEPLPTTHAASWSDDAGAVWCVWFGEPTGRPDEFGYIAGFPSGGAALRAVNERTLPVVRWLPPDRAHAWLEAARASWRAAGGTDEGEAAPLVFVTGAVSTSRDGARYAVWLDARAARAGADPIAEGRSSNAYQAHIDGLDAARKRGASHVAWLAPDAQAEAWSALRTRRASGRPHTGPWHPAPAPPSWRTTLDLPPTGPVSHEQLVAAWRHRAKVAHPDKGGSAEAFDRARRAYEAGLREVSA